MIEINSLEKSFGNFTALSNISLSIAEGSVTALIGPSGSGKSTLLRCINLLEIPKAGSITLGGDIIHFSSERTPRHIEILALRRRTGMIFQNFQLFPHLTVLQNVMEGLTSVQKWTKAKAKERASELLLKVGLAHKENAWPSELSGGQQQRVAIARALAQSPQILLCDEPTSALDPELALEVVAVLRKLATEGITMLIATHDLRLAASIAKTVVFLDNGRIVEQGTPQEIFSKPTQERTIAFVSALSNTPGVDHWQI